MRRTPIDEAFGLPAGAGEVFYDRDAHINLNRRYNINSYASCPDGQVRITIEDCGEVIHEFNAPEPAEKRPETVKKICRRLGNRSALLTGESDLQFTGATFLEYLERYVRSESTDSIGYIFC